MNEKHNERSGDRRKKQQQDRLSIITAQPFTKEDTGKQWGGWGGFCSNQTGEPSSLDSVSKLGQLLSALQPGMRTFCDSELFWKYTCKRASLAAQMAKNLPAVQETWVWSLGWEDPLKKGMATHSSILAWRILWIEESGGLQCMGCRVRHDWATNTHLQNQRKTYSKLKTLMDNEDKEAAGEQEGTTAKAPCRVKWLVNFLAPSRSVLLQASYSTISNHSWDYYENRA